MKFLNSKILFVFVVIFIFFTSVTHSQVIRCGVQDLDPEQVQQLRDTFNQWLGEGNRVTEGSIVTIPVSFHIIRYNDGSGGFNSDDVPIIISNLNNAFSGAKMRFFLYTTNFIDNDNYASILDGNEEEDEIATIYNINYVINIYIAENYGANGRATFTPSLMQEVGDTRETQSVIVDKNAAITLS